MISTDTVKSTGTGWKVVVPRSHVVDQQANAAWESLSEGLPYQGRLRALVLAKPWMYLIAEEEKRLFLEFDEWINKSSGRGTMKLLACDEGGDEEVVIDWGDVAFPGQVYQDVIHHVFPWAEFSIDEDFYEVYDDGQHIAETGHFDKGELVMTSMSLTEWRKRQARIRPYDILGGEVAQFRLELTINKLGRSFLRLDRYLESGDVEVVEASRRMSLSYGSGLKSLTQHLRPQVSDTPEEEDDDEEEDGEE